MFSVGSDSVPMVFKNCSKVLDCLLTSHLYLMMVMINEISYSYLHKINSLSSNHLVYVQFWPFTGLIYCGLHILYCSLTTALMKTQQIWLFVEPTGFVRESMFMHNVLCLNQNEVLRAITRTCQSPPHVNS